MKFKKKFSIASRFDTSSNSRFQTGVTARSFTWGSAAIRQVALCSGMALANWAQAQSATSPGPSPYDAPRFPSAGQTAPVETRRVQTTTDVFVANAPDTYPTVRGGPFLGLPGRLLREC